MKNGNLTEFLDKLYAGEELSFEYEEKEYFLQGWTKEDGTCMMTLDVIDENPFQEYIWECERERMKECADVFIKEPLWSGKTFLQVEKEVFWID